MFKYVFWKIVIGGLTSFAFPLRSVHLTVVSYCLTAISCELHGIISAGIPRIATKDTPNSFTAAEKQSVLLH